MTVYDKRMYCLSYLHPLNPLYVLEKHCQTSWDLLVFLNTFWTSDCSLKPQNPFLACPALHVLSRLCFSSKLFWSESLSDHTEPRWSLAKKHQYYIGAFIDWSHCTGKVLITEAAALSHSHKCKKKAVEVAKKRGRSAENRLCSSPGWDRVFVDKHSLSGKLHFMHEDVVLTRCAVLNQDYLVSLLRTHGYCGRKLGCWGLGNGKLSNLEWKCSVTM